MLRLLLSLLAMTALTPLRADDEPKPKTFEFRPKQDAKEAREQSKDQPDHRYTFMQTAYDPLWHGYEATVSPDNVFYFDIAARSDSDLALVEPDDALRAQLKLPAGRGLVAAAVREHGPAWTAGVRANDVLLSLDDAPLAKPGDLDTKLKQAGEKPMTLAIVRKGAPLSLKVQPRVKVDLGPVEQEEAPTYRIGVSVTGLGSALRAQLDVPSDRGLLVANVVEGGPAARGGLKINDILLTVAGKPLNSQPALSELVQKNGETPLEVEYLREGSQRTLLKLTPEKRKAGQTFKLGVFTPSQGATVVRRGSLQNGLSVGWTETPGVWDTWSASGAGLAPDGSAKRFDDMAAEIKELRKAIDGLRKALEDRK